MIKQRDASEENQTKESSLNNASSFLLMGIFKSLL